MGPHSTVLISPYMWPNQKWQFMKWGKGTGDENLVIRTSSSIWAMLLLLLQCKKQHIYAGKLSHA
jgi:hypothetical protein